MWYLPFTIWLISLSIMPSGSIHAITKGKELLSFFLSFFLKILFIYFYTEGMGRSKRGRETSMCGCLSHTHYWGPGPQPRPVPWLGDKPVTVWFTDQHSIHWHTPARAEFLLSLCCVVFHCENVPPFFDSLIYWWALRLLPALGYCKLCCCEHWGA